MPAPSFPLVVWLLVTVTFVSVSGRPLVEEAASAAGADAAVADRGVRDRERAAEDVEDAVDAASTGRMRLDGRTVAGDRDRIEDVEIALGRVVVPRAGDGERVGGARGEHDRVDAGSSRFAARIASRSEQRRSSAAC